MADAVGKRIKITKIQQHMLLAALGTSLVFGVSLVFSIFFTKYIIFNTKVIDEKDKSISNYYTAITNAGVCKKTANGKYSDKDLEKCTPTDLDATDMPGTLRYNILVGATNDNNLESVARDSQKVCYDDNGQKIDFIESYEAAKTDEERAAELYKVRMCSSLRVIPDALPSIKNDEALLSSINKVFLITGFEPESLSPSRSSEASPIPGLQVIPVTISVKEDVMKTTKLLQNLEKSIRSFSFQSARITWSGSENGEPRLDLSAQAYAFFTDKITASENIKTLYASKDAKTKGGTSAAKESGEK